MMMTKENTTNIATINRAGIDLVTLYTGLQGIFQEIAFQCVLKFSSDTDVVITNADMEDGSRFIRHSKRRLDELFYMVNDEFNKDFTIFETRNQEKKNQYYLIVGTDFDLIMTKYKSYGSVKKKVQEKHKEREEQQPVVNANHEMHIKGCRYEMIKSYGCNLVMDGVTFDSAPIKTHVMPWKYQFLGILYGLELVLQKVPNVEKIYIHPIVGRNMQGVYNIPLGKWPAYGKDMEHYRDKMLAYRDKFAEKGVSIIFRNA